MRVTITISIRVRVIFRVRLRDRGGAMVRWLESRWGLGVNAGIGGRPVALVVVLGSCGC